MPGSTAALRVSDGFGVGFHAHQHGAPSMEKSLGLDRKTFLEQGDDDRRDFRLRFSAALASRLQPNTGLARKVLAHALRVVPETIDNWLAGISQPDSYVMGDLIAFMDVGFVNEVYGRPGHAILKLPRRDDATQKLIDAAKLIEAVTGGGR